MAFNFGQSIAAFLRFLLHPGYISGRYYPMARGTIGNPVVVAPNTIGLLPCTLFRPLTAAALAANVRTAITGSCQLAIYAHDPVTNHPTGTPLVSTGNIDTSVAGMQTYNLGSNVTLPPGDYWMAVNANAATSFQTLGNQDNRVSWAIGSTNPATISSASTIAALCYTVAQAFGAWPDLTGVTPGESNTYGAGAMIFAKVA